MLSLQRTLNKHGDRTMKTYLFAIAFLLALLLIGTADYSDPDLSSLYPATPFDRCMASFEGTPAAEQCALLQVSSK